MRVRRTQLIADLESVLPGLGRRGTTEQSDCFLFRDGEVSTYNGKICYRHPCCLKLTGAIPAKLFLPLLKKLSAVMVEITPGERELGIRVWHGNGGLSYDPEISLPVEAVPLSRKWTPLPSEFLTAIDLVCHCAGGRKAPFALRCVHLHPEYIEAFDNMQAGRYTIETGLAHDMLVPADTIKCILPAQVTTYALTAEWIHFKNPDGFVLSCRRYPVAHDLIDLGPLLSEVAEDHP